MECRACSTERLCRCRLVEEGDPRLKVEPFLSAPFIHQNNQPKYNAALLRAEEHAKHHPSGPQRILWFTAQDTPNADEFRNMSKPQMQAKRRRWLQKHDQETAGLTGLLPLYKGLRVRATEKTSKQLSILKHHSGTVVGWQLHTSDAIVSNAAERVLQYAPPVIYVKWDEKTWTLGDGWEPGVFPMKPVHRTWVVNRSTGATVSRKGFQLFPDFAHTDHIVQGMTLEAAIVDAGDVHAIPSLKDMLACYVALSRVKRAGGLLLLRAFSPFLFTQGAPPGPSILMRLLRKEISPKTAVCEYEAQMEARKAQQKRPLAINCQVAVLSVL